MTPPYTPPTAENVLYLLDHEPLAVRSHEGGAPEESLDASLALTMLRMRREIEGRDGGWLPISAAPLDGKTKVDVWSNGRRWADCVWERGYEMWFGDQWVQGKPTHFRMPPPGPSGEK